MIENVQNALDDMGAVCKVVVHLDSRVSDVILQEALALMVKLLFGGNSQVQVSSVWQQLYPISASGVCL